MLLLPESARVACWLNAWLAGRHGADMVIDGVRGDQVLVDFSGLEGEPLSPALLLGALRGLGVKQASVALPVPGDPTGLGGPAGFNAAAHEAGEAVLCHGPDLGLLPTTISHTTRWTASTAHAPAYVADVTTADRELRDAVRIAANELAALDVATWNPEVADGLLNLRSPASFSGPTTFASASAAQTAAAAIRCRMIVALATADEGGSLSARAAASRRQLLASLDRAARAAIVAACSSLDGR
ncbi:MAG: hypothetical protein M3499_02250 [Actinomycetota bacterium]|nr:hypothetical protein [Actinomycetota bacterium]